MKLADIELAQGTVSQEVIDWMDNVRLILNNGRYQFRIIDTVPTWVTHEGEVLFYSDGAGMRKMYTYIDGQWCYATWGSGSSALDSYRIVDADADTKVTVEESADEDKIRIDTGGMERTVVDENGLEQKSGDVAVASGAKVGFEGISGDTYFRYNSATSYLECYVDGVKRMEM